MDNALVRLTQVGVSFNGQAVLSDVDLAIEPGQIVTLIGPNGAGKTTLVRSVLGLLKPHVGEVWRRPRLTIGYMPQKLHVDATLPLSVLRFLRLVPGVRREQALAALREVGAAHVLERPLQSISGGELQRVLLARALAADPEILLLDDSSSALDYKTDAALRRALARDFADTTKIIVAQRVSSIQSMTHILVMDNGRCIGYGTHQELLKTCPAYLEIYQTQMGALA